MIISASFLSANFLHLEKDAEMIDKSQADWFHLDVMDGSFVPNISFGPMIIKTLRPTTKKIFDVHLMIDNPELHVEQFAKSGADILTVHLEACRNLHRNIQQIKSLGIKAGVAINPHTPVSAVFDILEDVELVCIMSVNPGYGGQKFIPHSLKKISELKNFITKNSITTKIEVDGGVNIENAKAITLAGADILVAGNAIFNALNPIEAVEKMKNV